MSVTGIQLNPQLSGISRPRFGSTSDVFLSASHHEGIPIAILEAAAQGIPCVLTDIPGHKTLTKNTDNELALFFPVEDLKKMKESILKLHGNHELKEKLRINLFQTVLENYSSKTLTLRF